MNNSSAVYIAFWQIRIAQSLWYSTFRPCKIPVQLFQGFSPDCTLHSAITHVISVLERRTPTHDCAIGIHVSLRRSHTFIT